MQAALPIAHEQRAVVAMAAALCAACWAWSLREAERMHHGAGGWALFAMWAVMMVGMMIPPELPNVLAVARRPRALLDAAVFLAGFLAVWVVFSLGAAALHAWLEQAGQMDHRMALQGRAVPAALLAIAGAAQLSPLKRACLSRCRGTASPRTESPLGGGLLSGAVSVGSCGLLMLVLFATGVMSVPAMVLLTALLVLERIAPLRFRVSAMAGVALLLCACWRLLS